MMATPTLLEKLQAWVDPKLADVFNRKEYDPTKDREWVVARLESTKTQFSATESTRGGGRKLWKLANGVVAFSPIRPDKAPLVINGQTTLFIPSEHFTPFIDTMIQAVQAGDFDKELTAATTSGTSVALNEKPARAPRKPRSDGGSGWTQERRDRFNASVAARKAAKVSENA